MLHFPLSFMSKELNNSVSGISKPCGNPVYYSFRYGISKYCSFNFFKHLKIYRVTVASMK